MKSGPKPEDWSVRLMRHVLPVTETGCWLWDAGVDENGYGVFTFQRNGRYHRAHRISWMLFVGGIPKGKQVNHKCHVPSCVNPNHLYLGTQLENMRDMWESGRASRRDGEHNGRSKISLEQAMEIKFSGLSTRELSVKHGLCFTAIQRIRSGKAWSSLTVTKESTERAKIKAGI